MGDSTGDGAGNGELYPMGRGDSTEALEAGDGFGNGFGAWGGLDSSGSGRGYSAPNGTSDGDGHIDPTYGWGGGGES